MGVSFRSKSFIMGVTLASLTWSIILYLYVTILQSNLTEEKSIQNLSKLSPHPSNIISNDLVRYEISPLKNKARPRLSNDLSSGDDKPFHKKGRRAEDKHYSRHGEEGAMKLSLSDNELPGDPRNENSIISHLGLTKAKDEDSQDLNELGLVKTIADEEMKDNGYRLYAFNTLISSRLSLHRPLPDTRHEKCLNKRYPRDLPSTSIVVCFFRENLFTLLRSIHSILDRTPENILKEIILIDDTDEVEYHLEVKGVVSGLSDKVILLKTERREGLIRARIFGAQAATGEVLVFLDSHVEVNKVWLEPLLTRIQEQRTNVVTPVIDVISPDTFKYVSSSLVRGGFNWGLHFKWDSIPIQYFADKANFIRPIKSPTMAGGLFAIDRKFFHDLGEYDPQMDLWGGENLEMSFRIWMCGGTLEIVPCSRVGHIFRSRRPYGDSLGEHSMMKNNLRLAHVWLDDYIEKYFEIMPEAKTAPYGDITERLKLRKRLGCKSFKWYLDNVYPSLLNKSSVSGDAQIGGRKFERWDRRHRNYLNHWQIQLYNSSFCVESEEDPSHKGARLVLSPCAAIPRQTFYQTDKDELVLAKLLCLEASSKVARMGKCHDMGGNQEWKIIRLNKIALYNIATGLCLAALELRSGSYLDMALCSTPSLATWNLIDMNQI